MPFPPAFGVEDYTRALLNLLPRGRIWRRDADSILVRILGALAPTYARSTLSANGLLADTVPTTTYNLLPEWEASLGLPDCCVPADNTVGSRKKAVTAKWAARGGQTPAFFVKKAAALGFAISVIEFAPARFGIATFGMPMANDAWAYAWAVQVAATTIFPAQFGLSQFGDRYRTWGNSVLVCEINAGKPAHTTVLFEYV